MTEKLNILRIASPALPVTERLRYGGIERVIYSLHKTQRELGHDTYLIASEDSEVGEGLIPTVESMWKQDSNGRNIGRSLENLGKHYKTICRVASEGYNGINFDIIHDHTGTAFTTSQEYLEERDKIKSPIVVTLHGAKSNGELKEYLTWRALREIEKRPIYFNAISNDQRKIFESTGLPIEKVIFHGVDPELYRFNPNKQDYLFWIGRICKDKGTHHAIKIAQKTKRPLIIAGEVHSVDEGFYREMIEPHVDRFLENGDSEKTETERNSLIRRLEAGENIVNDGEIFYIGPVNDKQKVPLFRKAYATLVPNEWNEPFGLIMVESMMTGTPVIGYGFGSVPEVIGFDGGCVIEPIFRKGGVNFSAMADEATNALRNLRINPERPRKRALENFTSEIESGEYIKFFLDIVSENRTS